MPSQIQTTFEDVKSVRKVKALTDRQRQVLALLDQGVMQSGISRRLNITPARVCQIVSALEKKGLVKAKTQQATFEHRKYRQWFDVVPEAKIEGIRLTPFRAHNFRKKFRIIAQDGDLALDKRAGYNKSKKMRGPMRHVFWFPSVDSLPSVTVEWHIKSLVAYVDKGQSIPAESLAKATEMGWYALLKAKDRFVEGQKKYGVNIQVEEVGKEISEPHAGLVMHEDGPIPKEQPVIKGLWVDSSVQKELGPGYFELEGKADHPVLTAAEQGLMAAPELLKMFNEKFGALNQNVLQVQAMMQGGTPAESMLLQAVGLISRLTEKLNIMDDEIRKLKENQKCSGQ